MKHFFLQQLSFLLEEQQTGISPTASLKIRSINGFSNSTINDSTIISPCSMPVCVLVLKSLFDTGPVFSVSDVPLSVSINSTWVFGQSQKQFRQLRLVKFKARDSMKLWKWLLPWTWHIWMLCTVLGSPVQDRHGYTAVSLAEATKLVRGWSTSCRKRSWRSSFCSAWRRVGSGSHIAVYSYLMGSWRNGNSDGGERKKKKKKKSQQLWSNMGTDCQDKQEKLHLWRSSKHKWTRPEATCSNFKAGPTLSRGVESETSRGPLPPALFCVSLSLL